ILFIGGGLLGTGTLNDLSLVLFVGMLSGTYSSIFIATPVLADLKEREPRYKELAAKVRRREAGGRAATRATGGGAAGTAAPVVTVGADEPDAGLDAGLAADEVNVPGDEVTVPPSAARPARPTTRQQPRRGSTARRPGPRKKRR
ncbi:MAG TPA: hypothetical protein VG164_13035, partial [Trebonia sp.]|nr:hypothetical protein [Trebonia sp.]